MGKVCAQCENYLGGGDWSLCCTKTSDLCYETTPADNCSDFKQTKVCRNVTSMIGGFRCSICNGFKEMMVRHESGETIGEYYQRARKVITSMGECPFCGRKFDV